MPQFRRTQETPTVEGLAVTSAVEKCGRCGGYHQALSFRQFANGPLKTPGGELFSHWAACPVNGEPILAKATEGGNG